jgi:hypothetical protein
MAIPLKQAAEKLAADAVVVGDENCGAQDKGGFSLSQ